MFETLIAQGAARFPHVVAFRTGIGAPIGYRTFADDIRRCANWLARQKISTSRRAILQLDNAYLYWVLFFALEAHGVVTIAEPFASPLDPGHVADLEADVVFSNAAIDLPSVRWFVVDVNWAIKLRSMRTAPLPTRARAPEDPVCIVLSSGTTGAPKKVMLTRGMIDRRTTHAHEAGFLRDAAQIACLLPFASIGGLLAAFQAWFVSGSIGICGPATDWRRAFVEGSFNTLVAAPIHLEAILAATSGDMPRPSDLVILAGGGALSRPLAAALQARLTDQVVVAYGSTELGLVTKATIDQIVGSEESAGPVLPWMEVEVLDDDGGAAPVGQAGEIRVRGTDVVVGYYDEPDADRRHFRGGWYYPGDVGHVDANGILTISGRIDDLINIGGRKLGTRDDREHRAARSRRRRHRRFRRPTLWPRHSVAGLCCR